MVSLSIAGRWMVSLGLALTVPTAAMSATTQVGLPGYLADSEPLLQSTPQAVFDSLALDPNAIAFQSAMYPKDLDVDIQGDRNRTTYIFYGKNHWAYPSVIRFRRALQDGYWATRIAYLCGASERKCEELKRRLESRTAQVALMDPEVAARDAVSRLFRPLPTGMTGLTTPGEDFFIDRFTLTPDLDEVGGAVDKAGFRAVLARYPKPTPCDVVGVNPIYASRPIYPAEEAMSDVGAIAIVLAVIDSTGSVVSTTVERSSGHPRFDREAMNALSTYRYAMKDCASGSPDAVVARIPVEFRTTSYVFKGQLADMDAEGFGFGRLDEKK